MNRVSNKNKYGLGRRIPDEIARMVRQRDGYGCVVCGSAFYDYDHFDPEFAEARSHEVSGIILLCLQCHGRKTRKQLSRETIAKSARQPKARQVGFSFGPMDVGSRIPDLQLGPLEIKNCSNILNIDGEHLFSVAPPEEVGGPFRVNASFYNSSGSKIFEIIMNELRIPSDNWDASITANKIVFRQKARAISLSLRLDPPNKIVVERLNMAYGSTKLTITEGRPIELVTRLGLSLSSAEMLIDGCRQAVQIRDEEIILGQGGGSISGNSMRLSSGHSFSVDPKISLPKAALGIATIDYYQMFLDRKKGKS